MAKPLLEKALTLDSRNLLAKTLLGHIESGNTSLISSFLERSSSSGAEGTSQVRLSVRIGEEDQESAEAAFKIGIAHLGAKEYEKAENAFKEALRLNPDLKAARHNLSVALRRQGRDAEAKKVKDPYWHP